MPLLVTIGCPTDPALIQLFTWTGGLGWLLAVCVGFVVVFERVQNHVRARIEE